jgi:hypothetical protein
MDQRAPALQTPIVVAILTANPAEKAQQAAHEKSSSLLRYREQAR